MKSYSEKLKDPRWQRRRLEVMKRDEWKCRDCGDRGSPLNVHHSHYSRGGPWETPLELLLTLCESCHQSRQAAEEETKAAFAQLLCRTDLEGVTEYRGEIQKILSKPTDEGIGRDAVIANPYEMEYMSDIRWFTSVENQVEADFVRRVTGLNYNFSHVLGLDGGKEASK